MFYTIDMSITERIRVLGFPPGEYVVFGSAVLEVLGLRTAGDLDIAVLPTLYERLRASGEWGEEERFGKIFLVQEGIEISPQLEWEAYPTTTQEAIDSALVINGIPFLNLRELKKFKQVYGRPKDLADIALIDEYFSNSLKTDVTPRGIEPRFTP